MFLKKLSVFSLLLLLLVTPLSTLNTQSDTTPTPQLPVVTNVPLNATADQLPTRSGENNLPRAVTATPTMTTPAPSNFPLLDEAVNNTLTANSFTFAVNGTIGVQANGESGSLSMRGRGTMMGFSSFETLQLQLNLTADLMLPGQQQQVLVEMRIVNRMVYLRGEDPATGRKIRWIGIEFSKLLGEAIPFQAVLDSLNLLNGESTTEVDIEAFNDLIQLLSFNRYVSTTRLDGGGDEAHFQTSIDIDRFLRSDTDLKAFLNVLSRFGGLSINSSIINFIQPVLSQVLPQAELQIDRFVPLSDPRIARLEMRLDVETTLLNEDMLFSEPVELDLDLIFATSGYGGEYIVELPEDAVIVESLENLTVEEAMLP